MSFILEIEIDCIFNCFSRSSKRSFFVELRIAIPNCLMTHGSSDIHEALPARKTGFFNKLLVVLMTRSASEEFLVNLEK